VHLQCNNSAITVQLQVQLTSFWERFIRKEAPEVRLNPVGLRGEVEELSDGAVGEGVLEVVPAWGWGWALGQGKGQC